MANEQLRQAIYRGDEIEVRRILESDNCNPALVAMIIKILKGESVKGSGSKHALNTLVAKVGLNENALKGRW